MIKTNNILLLSNDNTITEYLKLNFPNSVVYRDVEDLSLDIALIILDDFNLSDCHFDNLLKNSNKMINISTKNINDVKSIQRPFSLTQLSYEIKDMLFKNDNVFRFKDFDISYGVLNIQNNEIRFGSKEILLIKYLYGKDGLDKSVLLSQIWGYNSDIETKVLENTVNNIRKKIKILNIDNFIVVNDGLYKIPQAFY